MAELIDHDPRHRISHFFEEDAGGNFTFGTQQDIEPVLETARDLRNMFPKKATWKEDVHHVAFIPRIIWGQMMVDGRLNDPEAIRAWVNHPDNQMFRTRPGKI